MSTRVTVAATGGPYKGRNFVFTDRTICTFGRSDDCLLRIQGGTDNLTVSRHHCLLDIDPPTVRVCDVGSLNGTFVNGQMIGQRDKGTPRWEAVPTDLKGIELHAGDQLVVGSSEFLIGIQSSAPDCESDALVGSLTSC
jgi:pSer/pThr/pTyr-binding forkhead associated (FHA) protein